MKQYHYRGRDASGKMVEGVLEAPTETAVANHLIRTGIVPLEVNEEIIEEDVLQKLTYRLGLGRPSLKDLSFFSRQMFSLTKAGIPLVRGMKVVAESTKNLFLKNALNDVINGIESGQPLGVAMSKHTKVFPEIMISLINVGESTGGLDKVFKQMSEYLDRELQTRNRIKKAVRYPIFVLVVIGVAIGVINIFVIPAFASFFDKFGATLPIYTRILVGISNFSVHYWPLVLLVIFLIAIGWMSFVKSEQGRYFWDRYKLRIPLIGPIIFKSLLSRFTRTFALSTRTGLPLLQAISLIAKAADNVYVEEKIMAMQVSIEHGETVTKASINTKMFSPLVLQMISIGEETGEMDRLLDEASQYYDEEVDFAVTKLSDAIEPILLVIMGALILVLALGIYLPLWDLSVVVTGKVK